MATVIRVIAASSVFVAAAVALALPHAVTIPLLSALGLIAVAPQLEAIAEAYLRKRTELGAFSPLDVSATVVVSAYLPNEQHIILDTIRHLLHQLSYPRSFDVLLVYNTPVRLAVEEELQALAAAEPRLRVVHAVASNSKAENLNTAMPLLTTSMTALYDADARPERLALARAAAWIAQGYDFVQGANSIRQPSPSLLSTIVAVEFAQKFFVSYSARYCLAGVTYFCGSNGYWSTEILRGTPFKEHALVEDIDAFLRSALSGAKYVYDPQIECSELAPPNCVAWWNQRLRWAGGWLQLMRWHQRSILRSDWCLARKLCWTFFLAGRRLLIPTACAMVLATFIVRPELAVGAVSSMVALVWAAAVHQGISMSASRRHVRVSARVIALYVFAFPLYEALRTLTTVVALYYHRNIWRVTPRPHVGTPIRSADVIAW